MRTKCKLMGIIVVFSLLGMGNIGLSAAVASDQQALVDKSRITFEAFVANPDFTWFHDHAKEARGFLIVPQMSNFDKSLSR